MAKRAKKVCRIVWFDEKDRHIPVKKIKESITPRYFANIRALACTRGEFSFKSGKLGKITAKSMSAKEQAKAAPPKKKPRRRNSNQQTMAWTKRKK
jgi:hypothetical protein